MSFSKVCQAPAPSLVTIAAAWSKGKNAMTSGHADMMLRPFSQLSGVALNA